MGVLTVIWWRDIPAQVVAKDGRRASKIVLHPRFQVAIDRAAVKAGRRSMDEYIAEWHKVQRPCGDDLEAEATAEVARLEATYTRRVLDHLVTTGGAEDPDAPATGKPTPAAGTTTPKPAAKPAGSEHG
jgi:cvfA/B/C family virulence factor